jgi:hypothetical protein
LSNKSILIISDLHAPYCHRDSVAFLKAIKDKYSPDRIICIGDEIDNHAMSFHPSDQSLYSAGDELKAAREIIWQIEELFPKVTVIESNHGSMAYRKALVAGIPKELLRPYKSVLDVKHWKWVGHHIETLPNKQPCYFVHGKTANTRTLFTNQMMSSVQGHFHEKFEIVMSGNGERLNFGMTVGCLIDDNSMAFHYNKVFVKRPVIGLGMIIDSQPHLIPLVMNRKGRWNGRVN